MCAETSAGRLEVVLDGGGGEGAPVFEPGCEISGKAVFTAAADTTVAAVVFRVRWETRGKGNRTSGEAWSHREELPEQARLIEAGRTVSWPFRCLLPDQPWSYFGTIVSIVWEAGVSLDVPWAMDPKASCEFTLRPR